VNWVPEPRGLPAAPEATTNGSEDREFVTALARGLRVLQAFDRSHPEMTLSEVSRVTALSAGTARRSLFTLGCLGYVGVQNKRYFLLPKAVSLGAAYLDAARIDEVILPFLRDLVAAAECDSCSLAVLDGGSIMHLANYSTRRLIRMTVGMGTTFPAYATSVGRVLLAALPRDQLEATLNAIERKPFTRHTVTGVTRLKALVRQAQKEGYARVTDELEEGLSSLAVPVLVNGETVAALNSSVFFRGTEDDPSLQRRLSALRQTADRIGDAVRRVPVLLHSLSPHAYRPQGHSNLE
jgi:IclR family pca regulon transcriptional regulator